MSFWSDFGGDIISSVTNLASIPLQDYYNRKSASKANDYALYSWNLANEYNHPAEQMKRYEEAGLNKNLIYGQQNTTSAFGTTGPAAPDVQGAMRNSLMDYYTVQNMKKSNDKLNAEIALLKAQLPATKQKSITDATSEKIRGKVMDKTGIDVNSQPWYISGPATLATQVAGGYEALEAGAERALEWMFGKKRGKK